MRSATLSSSTRRCRVAPRAQGPGLTLLATGPLTNVAAALALDPAMRGQVQDAIAMSGAVHVPGNLCCGDELRFDDTQELNAWVDPAATAAVIDAFGPKLRNVGLDATRFVPVTSQFAGKIIAEAMTPGGRVVAASITSRCSPAPDATARTREAGRRDGRSGTRRRVDAGTPERRAFFATLVICAALVAAPWHGHVDDQDAQLYLLVARTMARAHGWFDLSALPGFYAQFREHTPFGFWPSIAAIRLLGEWAVNPLNALFTLAAILVTGHIARRLGGTWAAIAAMLLLGTCESIWQYGGRPLLEPLLFLFATAAAGAALEDRWVLAAALGGTAALIKGPFGLLPLGCVALAKLPDRRGLLAAGASVVPLALFVWIDPGGGWRSVYLRERLLGLTSGKAANGIVLWWFPLAVTARRFWPGLPFLVLGALRALRERHLRPLAVACVLLLAALCVPGRKWGNHTYVAFPVLAVLAGVAAGALLEKLRAAQVANALSAGALAACLASASGLIARVLPPPCPFSIALSPALSSIGAGTPILVVAEPVDTAAIVELAAERRLDPWPLPSLPPVSSIGTAVVRDGIPIPPSWSTLARGGGWTLVRGAGMTMRLSRCPASPCAG